MDPLLVWTIVALALADRLSYAVGFMTGNGSKRPIALTLARYGLYAAAGGLFFLAMQRSR